MFFQDKLAAYREAFRVLKPSGRFVFSVWDRIEQNEFCFVVNVAVARLFPENPPGLMARTPYGYYDTGVIAQELSAAGPDIISVETVERQSHAPSARDLAIGFCQAHLCVAKLKPETQAGSGKQPMPRPKRYMPVWPRIYRRENASPFYYGNQRITTRLGQESTVDGRCNSK